MEFGADAIYLGIPEFSLRSGVNNFSEDEIKNIIEYAHKRNKKVYITVNIFAHNRHLKPIIKFFKKINDWKPNEITISDPGVIALAKKYCPKIPISLSTQENCTNLESAKFWFKQGVKKIILARELSLQEIAEIHKKIPKLKLEYFVHGAMCMSYSGRCLLSSYLAGRSANLGDCVQPCRWKYKISQKSINSKIKSQNDNFFIKPKGYNGEALRIEEDTQGSYILNSKDLCLIKYLDELKKAGITSFKIEGRNKSIFYVSFVSKIYSQALKSKLKKDERKKELNRLFKQLQTLTHRGYITGFLFGRENAQQNYKESHKITNYQFVGEVIRSVKNKKWKIYLKVHNVIFLNDNLEIIQPKSKTVKLKVKKMYEENGDKIKEAHGGQNKIIIIETKNKIEKMSVIRKKIKK
ncbi:MAG: U32 family peptidase [Xanthomonadaceae bacterium]|nr:U32 family peptidase [Rhodospirillaceae bacterium]NIA18018.1 U32 family peptidase [Xanthomonadaceae bacterium]